jgi:uncharacterized membrane protein
MNHPAPSEHQGIDNPKGANYDLGVGVNPQCTRCPASVKRPASINGQPNAPANLARDRLLHGGMRGEFKPAALVIPDGIMYALDLIFRFVHIYSAIVLAGGTLFMRFALLPGLASMGAEQKTETLNSLRPFWAKIVMASSGLLLVSGLYNAAQKAMSFQLSEFYNGLLGVKILLALIIFFLAARLSGRSAAAEEMRRSAQFWLNVNCALAFVLIVIASVLKESNPPAKPDARRGQLMSDECCFVIRGVDFQPAKVGGELRRSREDYPAGHFLGRVAFDKLERGPDVRSHQTNG